MADRMVFLNTALTGGGAGSLDAIVSTDRGDTNPLQDDDVAFVTVSSNLYFYRYNEASTTGESSPSVIRPDDIDPADPGRWLQQGIAANVDDTPVDGETAEAISSNWAFDHAAGADPHPGYVLEALFDAYSVLYADTDNTPARLTVAASTLVGRKSSGGIAALTMADLRTELGNLDGRQQAITCAAAVTLDWSLGATAYMTFDRDSVALTLSNGVAGQVYRLLVKQSAGGSDVFTYSTTIKWRGGSAPTLTTTGNAIDIFTFVYINSVWYGDCSLGFA